MGMEGRFVIPLIVSILILGTFGLAPNVFAEQLIDEFNIPSTIVVSCVFIEGTVTCNLGNMALNEEISEIVHLVIYRELGK